MEAASYLNIKYMLHSCKIKKHSFRKVKCKMIAHKQGNCPKMVRWGGTQTKTAKNTDQMPNIMREERVVVSFGFIQSLNEPLT